MPFVLAALADGLLELNHSMRATRHCRCGSLGGPIATSTIALRTGLLFRWLPLAGFLVGLLSLFAVGPVRTMNSGKLRYLRPNLTRRMGRQTVADGSGQSMH